MWANISYQCRVLPTRLRKGRIILFILQYIARRTKAKSSWNIWSGDAVLLDCFFDYTSEIAMLAYLVSLQPMSFAII